MRERTCGNCRFWCDGEEEYGSDDKTGECRRYAPRSHLSDDLSACDLHAYFPVLYRDSWCGEWESKKDRETTAYRRWLELQCMEWGPQPTPGAPGPPYECEHCGSTSFVRVEENPECSRCGKRTSG